MHVCMCVRVCVCNTCRGKTEILILKVDIICKLFINELMHTRMCLSIYIFYCVCVCMCINLYIYINIKVNAGLRFYVNTNNMKSG